MTRDNPILPPLRAAPFEPLTEARAELGESPVWSPRHGAYWWIDITGRRLFHTAPGGATRSWGTPEIPGFVQCLGGKVFVGMQSGVFAFDPGSGRFARCAALDAEGVRFNDACTDNRGRIWAGTMDLDNLRPCGVLYLFDPTEGRLTEQQPGFRTINGLAWDAARRRLYVSDSHPSVQRVWTCNETAGGLDAPAVFARFDDLTGRPDGAVLDSAGCYWIAGVGGGTIYRFGPDGGLQTRFTVPVEKPTKLAFGPGEGEMVLTSFADDGAGGQLHIWRTPDLGA